MNLQKLHLSKRVNTKSNLLLHKMMRIFPFHSEIKFTHSYHNYYGSSFYKFMQLELLICISTFIFKHFLYTNMPYICNANIYFSHLWWSHIIILFQSLDLNESSYLGLPQPTKISYLFTWFYIAIWTIFMTELATKC